MVIQPNDSIDSWGLNFLEYPFVREGMTVAEYEEEKKYYLEQGLENIKNGKYKPLWKQREERP